MNADVSLEVTGLLEGGPVAVGTRQRQSLRCCLEENNPCQSAALFDLRTNLIFFHLISLYLTKLMGDSSKISWML